MIYGDKENLEVFEEVDYRKSIKTKRRERIYQNTPYTVAMYELLTGTIQYPVNGSILPGIFRGIIGNQALFNIRYKDDVRVDLNKSELKYIDKLNVGDSVDVFIESVSHDPYSINGSVSTLFEQKMHNDLKALEDDGSVTAMVKDWNPAGYDMEIMHNGHTIPAFMPNTLAGVNRLSDPASIVGVTMKVAIESFSDEKGTYIVSRRRYLTSLIPEEIKKLKLETLYSGKVTGSTDFGVFVEFNECLTGMIHKTNIHPDYQHIADSIPAGTDIEFFVKEIIKDKIILTQVLRESLWDTLEPKQRVDGVVKDVKTFGILVLLDGETVGLVHTSEIEKQDRRFEKGQSINVKILSVDKMNRKIFLSL